MYLGVYRTRRRSELSSLQQLRDRERELEREVETLREEKEREVETLREERGRVGKRLEEVKENSRVFLCMVCIAFTHLLFYCS